MKYPAAKPAASASPSPASIGMTKPVSILRRMMMPAGMRARRNAAPRTMRRLSRYVRNAPLQCPLLSTILTPGREEIF